MELEGKIIIDLPLEEGISKAGNPWKKKSWVLETMGQFPRRVKFDVFGDRVSTLTFELNKNYIVSVDAESREFNGRWYTDLRAFSARESQPSMDAAPGTQFGQPQPAAQQGYQAPAQPAPQPGINIEISQSEEDELPF